jgi:hypothetical protein
VPQTAWPPVTVAGSGTVVTRAEDRFGLTGYSNTAPAAADETRRASRAGTPVG